MQGYRQRRVAGSETAGQGQGRDAGQVVGAGETAPPGIAVQDFLLAANAGLFRDEGRRDGGGGHCQQIHCLQGVEDFLPQQVAQLLGPAVGLGRENTAGQQAHPVVVIVIVKALGKALPMQGGRFDHNQRAGNGGGMAH